LADTRALTQLPLRPADRRAGIKDELSELTGQGGATQTLWHASSKSGDTYQALVCADWTAAT